MCRLAPPPNLQFPQFFMVKYLLRRNEPHGGGWIPASLPSARLDSPWFLLFTRLVTFRFFALTIFAGAEVLCHSTVQTQTGLRPSILFSWFTDFPHVFSHFFFSSFFFFFFFFLLRVLI